MKCEFKFYKNGFIIQKTKTYNCNYSGIEGDNWFVHPDGYINIKDEAEYLYNHCSEHILSNNLDDEAIECCINLTFVNKYIEVCKSNNIEITILFCESQVQFPQYSVSDTSYRNKFQFLGYDYAYNGGSFYSSIFNDLCFERISELKDFTLNQYGLFEQEEDLLDFINRREELELIKPKYTFELGDFIVYKLWKYIGDFPIKAL